MFIVFEDEHELLRESILKKNVDQEFDSDENIKVYSIKFNGSKFII